jgi:[ribosomal protein S18]-alanine N-acetyltransferase
MMWAIRAATSNDAVFIRAMTYEALYVPDGEARPTIDVLDQSDIAHYWRDFGDRAGDVGVVAEDGSEPVGAVWLRLLVGADQGYGHVSDRVPELSIATQPGYRGSGVGTALLRALLDKYPVCSLSTDPRNPSMRLYERFGFRFVGWNDTSITMARWADVSAGEPGPVTAWPTEDDLGTAWGECFQRLRVPQLAHPEVHGLVWTDGESVEAPVVNVGEHHLPAAILADQLGHRLLVHDGVAVTEVDAETLDAAVRHLAPADAATHWEHPNLRWWRELRSRQSIGVPGRAVAVWLLDESTDDPRTRLIDAVR